LGGNHTASAIGLYSRSFVSIRGLPLILPSPPNQNHRPNREWTLIDANTIKTLSLPKEILGWFGGTPAGWRCALPAYGFAANLSSSVI